MSRLLPVLLFVLFYPFIQLTGQEKPIRITGVVSDSTNKAPIPYVNVFIANTTIGTMTNEKGEFFLNIPMQAAELVLTHLGYDIKKVFIAKSNKQSIVLTVKMIPRLINIKEAIIIGKRDPSRKFYQRIFREYFLGDRLQNECILKNPEVLEFRNEGLRIIANAGSPLIIDNFRLGYSLKYYLDFFVFQESGDVNQSNKQQGFYSFQGIALFEEMKSDLKEVIQRWHENRMNIYAGSLSNFLSSVYKNKLSENKYTVLKPGLPATKQPKNSVSGKMKKNKVQTNIEIDSVFYFDRTNKEQKYLYYEPENYFPIFEHAGLDEKSLNRSLKFTDSLLIFRDTRDTPELYDDETTLFFIGNGKLVFNKDGLYQIFDGDLIWGSLDTAKKLIKLLPLDYQPIIEK